MWRLLYFGVPGRLEEPAVDYGGLLDGMEAAELMALMVKVQERLKDLGMGSRFFITRFYDEAEAVIHEQFDRAVKIIEEHREILLKLTDLLLANKSLDQTQLDAFFDENLREAAQE